MPENWKRIAFWTTLGLLASVEVDGLTCRKTRENKRKGFLVKECGTDSFQWCGSFIRIEKPKKTSDRRPTESSGCGDDNYSFVADCNPQGKNGGIQTCDVSGLSRRRRSRVYDDIYDPHVPIFLCCCYTNNCTVNVHSEYKKWKKTQDLLGIQQVHTMYRTLFIVTVFMTVVGMISFLVACVLLTNDRRATAEAALVEGRPRCRRELLELEIRVRLRQKAAREKEKKVQADEDAAADVEEMVNRMTAADFPPNEDRPNENKNKNAVTLEDQVGGDKRSSTPSADHKEEKNY